MSGISLSIARSSFTAILGANGSGKSTLLKTLLALQPAIAGKPFPYILELALNRIGTARDTTYVVGDRLETDIAGGQALGCPTALMLSGVSTLAEAQAWKPKIDVIAADLGTLVGA